MDKEDVFGKVSLFFYWFVLKTKIFLLAREILVSKQMVILIATQ